MTRDIGRMLTHAISSRSLIYVEGDASMNKFTAKDGTAQSALSIVQRGSSPVSPFSGGMWAVLTELSV